MKGEPLAEIKPGENKAYVDNFLRLVSKQTPHLSISELEKFNTYPEKPVIGQVLEGCFNYERILDLRRFEKVHQDRRTCLVVGCINGNYGLGIGCCSSNVEIFPQAMGKSFTEYFLYYSPSQTETMWIKPPQSFLKETLALLPASSQSFFKELNDPK